MKPLLLAPLLISISLFNMGFMFKKPIKGIVCGEEEFFKTLKREFLQKNIYKQAKELNDLGTGIVLFFDAKTGQLYKFEKYSNSLKPFHENKSNNKKYIWTYQGSIDQKKLVITFNQLLENREPDPEAKSYQEVFYFEEMVYRYEYDGKKYEEQCEYFPIPKEVKINK